MSDEFMQAIESIEKRLGKLETKGENHRRIVQMTPIVAIVLSAIALALSIFTTQRELPKVKVHFEDQAYFFRPDESSDDPTEPDWIYTDLLISNSGVQTISIIDAGLDAIVGNERIQGFRIDLLVNQGDFIELPVPIEGGKTINIGFSWAMSGLGLADLYEMRWRNLPPDSEFELYLTDSNGKTYTKVYSYGNLLVIDFDTVREYQEVLP